MPDVSSILPVVVRKLPDVTKLWPSSSSSARLKKLQNTEKAESASSGIVSDFADRSVAEKGQESVCDSSVVGKMVTRNVADVPKVVMGESVVKVNESAIVTGT